MCYSAQITAAYQKLVRMTGATLSLQEFAALHVVHPENNCPGDPEGDGGRLRDLSVSWTGSSRENRLICTASYTQVIEVRTIGLFTPSLSSR